MNEIDVAAFGDAAEQGAIGPDLFQPIPSDLRNFQAAFFRKTHDRTLKQTQTGHPAVKLLAAFKQRLVSDANPQKEPAGLNEPERCLDQFLLLQSLQAVIESADSRQHGRLGVDQVAGAGHNPNVSSDFNQSLMHAPQIARSVIQQRNHPRSLSARVYNCDQNGDSYFLLSAPSAKSAVKTLKKRFLATNQQRKAAFPGCSAREQEANAPVAECPKKIRSYF